ncbi:MAG: MG2 domain-containing protein [Melioribacteraceae bacterium]|nr:MG2 domain-containing protein [Melioribacteraceae bacterium]
MKLKYFFLFGLIFLSLFLISCSDNNSVEIISFSPAGETTPLTYIQVHFSKSIAPTDKIEKWIGEELIEFEPKIVGKYKWTNSKTLIFSPDYPLRPSQKYTANISDQVLNNTQYSSDFETYEFHTQYFDAIKAEYFWTQIEDEDYRISVKANLVFNYPVLPDMLKQNLKVTINGKVNNNYEIISDKSSKIIAVDLGEIKQTDKNQDLVITIKKGLKSVNGKMPTTETRHFSYRLPPLKRVAITGVSSGYDGTNGWIFVNTTQKIKLKEILKHITLKPAKDIKVSSSENGFKIDADFMKSQTVTLSISKGLPGLYGGELEFDYEQIVTLVDIEPAINFSSKKGKYLLLGGNENLEVNTVNVKGVEIEVARIYKNNLLHFLNNYSYYYSGDYDYNIAYYYGNYGDEVFSEKKKLASERNWQNSFNINLNRVLKDKRKGIYTISVRSDDRRWLSDSKMIAISDMGIITKKSESDLIVFVNSISSANPIANVKVEIISSKNQIMFKGKTDEDGVIHFKNIRKSIGETEPILITCELDDDFNYIDLRETEIETSRFDVGGITQYSNFFNAFLYSARNIYRPGEEVVISGIVRDENITLPEELPVYIKVISPTGKIFSEYKKRLNKQGSFELFFTLPDYAQTGTYFAELYVNSKEMIGSYKFKVEEFVPDKIRVTVSTDKAKYLPNEKMDFEIDAEFLFGAKASGLKYEADIQLKSKKFKSKNYPKFNFANSSVRDQLYENSFVDDVLDDSGKGVFSYRIPKALSSSGYIQGTAFVSVFDLTGRTVNKPAMFRVFPKNHFIGIRSKGYYYGVNSKLKYQFIAVDKEDNVINNFETIVELVRYEWQTVLKKSSNNRFYYASEKKEISEWKKELLLSGKTNYQLSVDKSGHYEIRIYKNGSKDYQKDDFYVYGWGGSTASTFEVNKEGKVEILFDKEAYEPGDEATILFTTPFSGKMLVSFERDKIYDYKIIDVKNKSAELKIDITEEYLPNIYISATLFKGHSERSETPFLVGHGYKSITVEQRTNWLPLQIAAPTKIEPRTKQKIKIKSLPEKDIFITLAVVDEGILQLNDYKTPDAYSYMYAKRPLSVESFDLYKLLLPEIVSQSSFTGGDALAKEFKKRTNPVKSKRFKLLSYWSGIRSTDNNGEVIVEVDIPQYNGEVRLMALAYSGKRFGNAEARIKVADKIIIEAEIPRFLTLGDSLVSNVTILNPNNLTGVLEISLKVEGPLRVVSDTNVKLTLEKGKNTSSQFQIVTKKEIGVGKIIIQSSGVAKVKEEVEISVRPASALVTETGDGVISADENIDIKIPNGYLEETQNTSILISKFPTIKLAKHLRYLVGYPYGCLEQTTSKVFPQLYFEELAKLAAPKYYKTKNPKYYVMEGIRKIESMQLYDGSFRNWQGRNNSNWWATVYAAHFLVEAKSAGYNVSGNILDNVLKYLSTKAKMKQVKDRTQKGNNKTIIEKTARKEVLYSLFVLALAKRSDISMMNYYKAHLDLLTIDSQYLLAAAYGLSGKMNSFYELLPTETTTKKIKRKSGGDYDSEIRANAIMLYTLLSVDPENEKIPFMVKHLSKISESIYSTQERAFAMLALGKAASLNSESNVEVEIIIDEKTIDTFVGDNLRVEGKKLNTSRMVLSAEGSGKVFYSWETEGVKIDTPVVENDSHIKIRKKYYNYKTGNEITNNVYKQGDLIVAKISLTGFEQSAKNIVISDLIPAGFEIENPRLQSGSQLNWNVRNKMQIDYLDIRDDRLLIFTNLIRKRTTEYYYLLRAVSKGKFILPAIGAEAMYDGEIHSYSGYKKILIKK